MRHAFILFSIPIFLFSNPKGEAVISGDVAISREENLLKAEQTTDHAIVEWDSFSIGKNETVQISQPSEKASILNRVVGSDLSEIYGNLLANGTVLLINPQGVIFGETGFVETGVFVGSTLALENQAYLNNENLIFYKSNDCNSLIEVGGTILTTEGDILLLGQVEWGEGCHVSSKGQISTFNGDRFVLSALDHSRLMPKEMDISSAAVKKSDHPVADSVEVVDGRVFLVSSQEASEREYKQTATTTSAINTSQINEDSLVSLQQMRTLIPERLWYQEFSILVKRKAFYPALQQWMGHKLLAKGHQPRFSIGSSECYFLEDTISGEMIRILDTYQEFLQSPFWKTPPKTFDLNQTERNLMGNKNV